MVKISFYDPDDEEQPRRRSSKEKAGFTLDWVHELGWESDPFSEQHAALADFEDERQEINLFFIKNRSFGVFTGEHGMGKSTLLRWLVKELGGYNELQATLVDAKECHTAGELRVAIADEYRGMFRRGKPLDDAELIELLEKKVDGRLVLLVDNGQALSEEQKQTLTLITEIRASVLVGATEQVKGLPKDELELVIDKRDPQQYEKILGERIQSAGGKGTHPFTQRVIETMAEDTDTTAEFLDLARETAINIALKRVTLDEDVEPDKLAEKEEAKAERKKGVRKKAKSSSDSSEKKSAKKAKYDELIESLTEGMD